MYSQAPAVRSSIKDVRPWGPGRSYKTARTTKGKQRKTYEAMTQSPLAGTRSGPSLVAWTNALIHAVVSLVGEQDCTSRRRPDALETAEECACVYITCSYIRISTDICTWLHFAMYHQHSYSTLAKSLTRSRQHKVQHANTSTMNTQLIPWPTKRPQPRSEH